MKLFDFTSTYPNEESCMLKFKQIRDKVGVVCPKCGCRHHYWLDSHNQYQCKYCGHRMNLRAGTALHGSKLPYRYWFIAFHLLTATKHTFSASEIQRQLGHKRYQPIWEMVHKIRSVMGQRDEEYTLLNEIELDEGFFSTEIIDSEKNEKLKRGAGSQAKTKVLVMAESTEEINPRYQNKPRKVGHIKMIVLSDLKSQTINGLAEANIDKNSTIFTDACKSHSNFKYMFKEHHSEVIEPKEIGKKLPWVHIAIANAKTTLADTYHGVKREFLQSYLNEFCYKFNRRYFGEDLFERLVMINAEYKTKFQHKTYAKIA